MSFFEDRIPKYRILLLKTIMWINIIFFLVSLFIVSKAGIITLTIANFALSGTILLMQKYGTVFNTVLNASKMTRGLNSVLKSYG